MGRKEIVHRFRLVALGYAIFAGFVVAGIWVNSNQNKRLDRQATAIVRLSRSTTAALCLIAQAPSQEAQNKLIRLLVSTGKIDISHSPECQRAASKAAKLILVYR